MPDYTVPPRSAIAKEHTWNAESVYATPDAWEAEFATVQALVDDIQAFDGKLTEGPETLRAALDTFYAIELRAFRLLMYAAMSTAVDATDQAAAALEGKASGLMGRITAAGAFLRPAIIAIGQQTIDQWTAQDRDLAVYRQYFADLFRMQAHVRNAEVEETLGLVSDAFGGAERAFNTLTNGELPFVPARAADGTEILISQANIQALLSSEDRETRRTAWESYADSYLKFKGTFAQQLATTVKQDVFLARVRRYDSALEAKLAETNIPTAVYHNFIATFQRNLPTWHRFWRIRRRVLGVPTLHTWDLKAPLTAKNPTVSYQQAIDWISAALAPLGSEYVDILRRGTLEERWVDIYPNAGKFNGAFSFGTPGTYPFIVMSYTDAVKSMSTLAHELGHSLHSYYIWHAQPLVYNNYSTFIAEVASNFHQAMLRSYLFREQPDRDFQLALIDEALNNYHRYFFIMPTLARFELAIHERVEQGESLTAANMNALLADLFAEGYGGEVETDPDREGITWAQFGHFFNSFYVFQYGTGISAANALAERVLAGTPQAVEDYLQFLRAGSSVYPVDALKLGGVDLTQPIDVASHPMHEAFSVLADLVDRLDALTQ